MKTRVSKFKKLNPTLMKLVFKSYSLMFISFLCLWFTGQILFCQDFDEDNLIDEFRKIDEIRKLPEEKVKSKVELNSYIYIDDYEIRIEILIPFYLFETWIPMERKDPGFLEIEEQNALKKPADLFFKKYNLIEIDGIPVKPVLQNLIFFPNIFADVLKEVPPRTRVNVLDTWVGAFITYSTKGIPDKVNIKWNLFDELVNNVRTLIFTYKDKFETVFQPGNTDFSWQNPGRPVPPPINEIPLPDKPWWAFWESENISEENARSVFSILLKNIYRAFDYKSESDIYDALAKSVEGELLTDLYLKIRKGLEMQEQGGTVSRIDRVNIIEGKMGNGSRNYTGNHGFNYNCSWTVKGTVEHWGHIHSRTNRYKAMFTVLAINKSWKITGMQVLDQEIGKIESVLR